MISLTDAIVQKDNPIYGNTTWEWPRARLKLIQFNNATHATLDGEVIWKKEGYQDPSESWSELTAILLNYELICAPIKKTYHMSEQSQSITIHNATFDEWLQHQDPNTYPEKQRLTLTKHYVSVLMDMSAEQQRKPSNVELSLLKTWLNAWDWTGTAQQYDPFITHTLALYSTKFWIARMSKDDPKFGLRFALYCAVRMNEGNETQHLEKNQFAKPVAIDVWYEQAKLFAHPVLKSIRTPKTCYVDHVIESYVKAKMMTRTDAHNTKDTYRIHKELFGVEAQSPRILKVLWDGLTTAHVEDNLHLPDNLIMDGPPL